MKVGNSIKVKNKNWSFGNGVPETFQDHVIKSVPGYLDGHNIVLELSDFFCHENSNIYELGTSTAELISKIYKRHSQKKSITFNGIDSEKEMINKAKMKCKKTNINLHNKDITKFKFKKSDFIISYYTIQFIHPKIRQVLINNIYESLNWGGGFVWFEKVRAADARFQDMTSNIYNNFKLNNGFSHEEILNKTNSLKGVMEPFSSKGNLDLLKRAGFEDILTIYKNICFEGLICIK